MADHVPIRSIADGVAGMEFAAPRTGTDAARGYFSALRADWNMIHSSTDSFLVDGEEVVVFASCSWRYRPTGKTAETPVIHRWRFENGAAVECFEFYDTARALAATRVGE
jgi:ketosteroid isomerase-like protein